MSISRVRVAYHEAGHAVMLAVHDVEFGSISIEPASGHEGCVTPPPGGNFEFSGDRDFVACMAGGVLADRIKRGRADFTLNTIRAWHRHGWLEPDIDQLVSDPGLQDKGYLLRWVHYTARQLTENWRAVGAVAVHLLERKQVLTAAEVAGVMQAEREQHLQPVGGASA